MRNVMKLFVATTFMIVSAGVSANVVCEIGRDKAKSDLRQYLLDNYGSNYAFIERHLVSGMNDFDRICKIKATEVDEKILKYLNKYAPNYSFIYRHYQANRASYDRLMKDGG